MPKFKVTAKCLSLASGEIIKSEIIEATNKEDAVVGFMNRFMTIEIIRTDIITGDKHLDYLYNVLSGIEHEYNTMIDRMDENDARFQSLKDQKFLLQCIIQNYKRENEIK